MPHPGYDDMRSFKFREENGYLPDDVYVPTEEDDWFDPEAHEIRAMVEERYAHNNGKRREDRLRNENEALRKILEDNGIDVDF